MANVNIEMWFRKWGAAATIRYSQVAGGDYEVEASCYNASPAILKLRRFTVEASARQFCELLRQQYQTPIRRPGK